MAESWEDILGAARQRWKKGPSKVKKYLCATKPVKGRSRKGKFIWKSTVRYLHKDGRERVMVRVVGRDPKTKPKEITSSAATPVAHRSRRRCRS